MDKQELVELSKPIRYWRVSGGLLPGNRLMLRPSYLCENPRGAVNLPDSPLQIELYQDQRLLLRWGATLLPLTSFRVRGRVDELVKRKRLPLDGPALVRAKVPFRTETNRIVFRYREIVLKEIGVPAKGPEFIGEPAIERVKDRDYRLHWQTTHPENLPVYYHVRASADGGKSWVRLASRLAKPELVVRGKMLAGGKECVLEVVAYDGVNTTVARVEVADAPPTRLELVLLSPRMTKEALMPPVPLHAIAQVRGKPGLSGERIHYEWWVDGNKLAEGMDVLWRDAPPGRHLVVVHARLGGLEGEAGGEIVVGK